jgi:N4-gp56 family major capsid protein
MSYTGVSDVAASTPEIWAKSILRSHRKLGFWRNMIGPEGSGKPIIQKSELLNNPGDTIHVSITAPLTGTGVIGDDARLDGREEAMSTSAIKAAPQLHRHALRWNRRANKKNIVELRSEGKMRLGEWGMVRMEEERWRYFLSDGTDGVQTEDVFDTAAPEARVVDPLPVAGETYNAANEYVFGELANEAAISDSNGLLTVRDLQVIKVVLDAQNAKPLYTVEGEPVYVACVSPNAAFNLKRDSEYQLYVSRARERAATNPLFTGALAMVDGVVVFESTYVRQFVGTHGDTPDLFAGIAFGQEAFIEALDEQVHSGELDNTDYQLHKGFSYEFAFQPRRALELNSLKLIGSDQRTTS